MARRYPDRRGERRPPTQTAQLIVTDQGERQGVVTSNPNTPEEFSVVAERVEGKWEPLYGVGPDRSQEFKVLKLRLDEIEILEKMWQAEYGREEA
jgi:hypothetical protein